MWNLFGVEPTVHLRGKRLKLGQPLKFTTTELKLLLFTGWSSASSRCLEWRKRCFLCSSCSPAVLSDASQLPVCPSGVIDLINILSLVGHHSNMLSWDNSSVLPGYQPPWDSYSELPYCLLILIPSTNHCLILRAETSNGWWNCKIGLSWHHRLLYCKNESANTYIEVKSVWLTDCTRQQEKIVQIDTL